MGVLTMTKWETAKTQLDAMEFPSQAFYAGSKGRSYTTVAGVVVEDEQLNGIHKTARRHKLEKTSHQGMSVKITGLMTIEGYATEFVRDYCLKCERETKLQGTVFNPKDNSCYIKTFKEDKSDFDSSVEEFMGRLD